MRDEQMLGLLRGVVDEETLREGVESYRNGCVKEVEVCGEELVGFVEDGQRWQVEKTEVRAFGPGELSGYCTCDGDTHPCHHLVATVAASAKLTHRTEAIETDPNSPRGKALTAVRRAGRCEVAVDPLTVDEDGYGVWKAQTMAKHRPSSTIHRVELLSRSEPANQCTCREFQFDELGTCRHIEAVLHTIGLADERPPRSVVYVDWREGDPKVRVLWSERHLEDPPPKLAEMFESDDVLIGPLKPAVRRLEKVAQRVRSFVVGTDVRQLVEARDIRRKRRKRRGRIRREMGRSKTPPGFRGTLKAFQKEGVQFMVQRGRALLADEMGLGKTVQAIAAANWMFELDDVERVLVVCPASIKHQWADEIRRFTDHSVEVVEGPKASRLEQYRGSARFLIVNYEIVMREASRLQNAYTPDLLIADEAQRFKNRDTLTSDAMKWLRAEFCFMLTGTPIENRTEDLFSLMELLDPRVLGPFWKFNGDGRARLHAIISPFVMRRGREILEDALPARTVEEQVVTITKKQLDYQQAQLAAAAMIKQQAKREGRPLTPGEHAAFMGYLMKARMASNSMYLINGKTKRAPKVEVLKHLVSDIVENEDRKIVVFSEWIRSVDLAREVLNAEGIKSLFLNGSVPTSRRPDLLKQFADDPTIRVLFSTEAGGVGLNLQMASVIINMELPWNPARLDQRIARVHRLGQTEDVRVINLIGTGYERMQLQPLLGKKRRLAQKVLEPTRPTVRIRRKRKRELGFSEVA